ncbi:substrate-binding domain-containing protein [Thalassotalea euphylliae]|uniref:substrate-binding domain-containing protein n=1 Tax=Thalassotalea euphylliae TaxID=1655234 RepID=UPI0015F27857|nr:substrate-binding domain-containing protein [Thalassotalea euphylliae]
MYKLALSLFFLAVVNFAAHSKNNAALVIDGSTGVKPLIEVLAQHYLESASSPNIQIGQGLSPKKRIAALKNNKIDIAMASHGFDVSQLAQLNLRVHPFAKVAVVMGVNHTVKVDSISEQQLCATYSGAITNWQQLGGADIAIAPFIRPADEVDSEVFLAKVSCFAQLTLAKNVQIKKKSGQMARAIANERGAIGMTTLVRVSQSDNKIAPIGINGILPTTDNVLNNTYGLTRNLYLITSDKPKERVKSFLRFVRSQQGAEVIKANHAVPLIVNSSTRLTP